MRIQIEKYVCMYDIFHLINEIHRMDNVQVELSVRYQCYTRMGNLYANKVSTLEVSWAFIRPNGLRPGRFSKICSDRDWIRADFDQKSGGSKKVIDGVFA